MAQNAPAPKNKKGPTQGSDVPTPAGTGPVPVAVGDKGPKGPTGAAGPHGERGDKGPTGAVGAAGPVGDKGPAGAAGQTGPVGDKGATGPLGPVGDQGAAGPVGAVGATGDTGPRGAVGPVGAPGLPGEQGVSGKPGAVGPARWSLPTASDLLGNVASAAFDLSPRTVVDPRVGLRYVARLTSALVKLPGGLLLRALVTEPDHSEPDRPSNVRHIA